MTDQLRLAVCFGTRPQLIKASVLLEALRERWPVLAVDTGQHYDFELNGLLYRQLGVPEPDHFLGVGSAEAPEQTAAVFTRTAELLRHHRPTAVIVIGDTNSTLGCALAANKLNLSLIHVEAGLRAKDPALPEETNRRVVDVIAGLLCAPSHSAATRLSSEGVPGRVVTTGDIARDTLQRHLRLAPTQSVPRPFALVTLHRAALTSDPDALRVVLDALGELDMAIVFPVHPRTRGALDRFGLLSRVPPTVTLIPPLGYLETIATVRDAEVVITDSGGLQREAYWLGTPCVTLRSETEWVETLECGANTLVDPPSAGGLLTRTVADQRQRRRTRPWTPDAYGDGRAAPNIVQAVGRFLGVDPAR